MTPHAWLCRREREAASRAELAACLADAAVRALLGSIRFVWQDGAPTAYRDTPDPAAPAALVGADALRQLADDHYTQDVTLVGDQGTLRWRTYGEAAAVVLITTHEPALPGYSQPVALTGAADEESWPLWGRWGSDRRYPDEYRTQQMTFGSDYRACFLPGQTPNRDQDQAALIVRHYRAEDGRIVARLLRIVPWKP